MDDDAPTDDHFLTGQLLIAMPAIDDERFAQSVIYLCAHTDEGAMGIVLNRPLRKPTFEGLLRQLDVAPTPPARRIQLCQGGPVDHARGFVLHTADWTGDGSLRVDERVALTASLDVLKALAEGDHVVAAVRTWSGSWLVRFAIVGLVLSQVLFIRFPWKMAHLLPTLLCLAILYAVALQERPRVLMAMAALQLVFCIVRVDVLQPNDANEATGGTFRPSLTWGPVVTDWQCRRDDPDAYLGRQIEEIQVAWDCAAPYRD